jgi:uncharacterized membrane protein YdbT with pleckstrin-like domain
MIAVMIIAVMMMLLIFINIFQDAMMMKQQQAMTRQEINQELVIEPLAQNHHISIRPSAVTDSDSG